MKRLILFSLITSSLPSSLFAFCGFYVAKADAKLFNSASQVVYVRNENKNVISMLNDFKGDLKEFAIVVPVPQVLQKGQIHVGDKKLFEHLDAYSAPRLVEYFDEDPCNPIMYMTKYSASLGTTNAPPTPKSSKVLGVTVEAQYTVGEYDIVILSAKESTGLETWLIQNGYKIPVGAHKALEPYIKQDLKFFVAKVNLKEQLKTGLTFLRPLQFAFDSPKFMLPIRLGMLNGSGSQDLIIYLLTQSGRVETTNYRTVKLPTGMDIPLFIKKDFSSFYKDMFSEVVKKENNRAVFTEYFWNMNWCDPCAADPLTPDELRELGVFWLDNPTQPTGPQIWRGGKVKPAPYSQPTQTMLTRLHVRYSPETFAEDLMFQETKDQENFQGRYVLRHEWTGNENQCPQAKEYFRGLPKRRETEAQNLATLTGWDIGEIRKKSNIKEKPPVWWEGIWGK